MVKHPGLFFVFSVSLLLLLSCINILPISKVSAPPPNTILSVEPPGTGVNQGDIFQLDVNVTDVEFLYGYEFRLFYNMYVITALDIQPPGGSTNGPGFFFTNETGQGWKIWKWQIDNSDPYGNGTGFVWLSLTRPLSVHEGLSGSGRLGGITFSADSIGISPLTFSLHILGDPLSQPINHTVREGMVVVGSAPTASFTYAPPNPLAGESVTFDASISTGYDGATSQGLVANWDFGDGTNGTDIVTTHAYSAAGTYTANLTVMDPINRTASTTQSVIVASPDTTPPIIGTPSQVPAGALVPEQEVKVSVEVTDSESGVKNATLLYTIDDGISWTTLPMSLNSTSGLYEATIPTQPVGTQVKYKITAYDNAENQAVLDNAGSYYVYIVVTEIPPALLLPIIIIVTAVAAILVRKKAKQSH